jgi:hypothetical protein
VPSAEQCTVIGLTCGIAGEKSPYRLLTVLNPHDCIRQHHSATMFKLDVPNRDTATVKKRTGVRNSLLLAVAILGLSTLAWIAFRRARSLLMLGYVDSAISRLRVVVTAEDQFERVHPQIGYTCTRSQLPPQRMRRLAKDGKENGYAFDIIGCQPTQPMKPNSTYRVTARPLHSGLPAFCSDQSEVVRYDKYGSVEKCVMDGIALGN